MPRREDEVNAYAKDLISRRTVRSRDDPVYGSDLVQKFINSMMWDGKKIDRAAHFLRRDGADRPESATTSR